MLRKSFLIRIFDAANMQRWNDKVRPVELRELDKQAHKMVIAWLLGKHEEDTPGFDWLRIIEGGIFEFLQRLVITDLKPQIFYRIKDDSEKYRELNDWVFSQLEPMVSSLGDDFKERFRAYFREADEDINRNVLNAAHFYATKWEFNIIERADPKGYEIKEISDNLNQKQEQYSQLYGMGELLKHVTLQNFVSLCGQLRFQVRWSHQQMLPRTSVLGHMLIVAIFTYLFSLQIEACDKRRINNFFTGLFHDLPEVLTRDIISPVKKSGEWLENMLKEYEREQMKNEVYKLIPPQLHGQMQMYTEDEFSSIVSIDGNYVPKNSQEINESFNEDRFDPRDGELVKAADHLAAYIEAYLSMHNGLASEELDEAKWTLKKEYKSKSVAGINFGEIYADFD